MSNNMQKNNQGKDEEQDPKFSLTSNLEMESFFGKWKHIILGLVLTAILFMILLFLGSFIVNRIFA
jgi:hypothetical protein